MDKFTAATWNMGGGEGPTGPTFAQVKNLLSDLKHNDVSIILGQEVQKDENVEFLQKLGYSVHQYGKESVVAWDSRWVGARLFGSVLNPTEPYHRKDNPTNVFVKMARVILCDSEGQTVDVGSYHTPSSVQEKVKPPRRIAALKESMGYMSSIAAHTKCHAVLLGGDDNVDEEEGAWGPWDFMRKSATGLNLVTAPKNTLGKRKVDDFRTKNLKTSGEGAVLHGPTDHNAHIRTFILPS